MAVAVDYSLMDQQRGPIAGPGSEIHGTLTGWSWCGYCGFTGRVEGPRQARCPERHGWHCWLKRCADIESLFYRLTDKGREYVDA
jgi:hypothetical protein